MGQAICDLIMPTDSPAVLATADQLLPFLYEDLHRLAKLKRRQSWNSNTLQTTALINEAYLKLQKLPGFNDHDHFLRAAAIAMRHILVNHSRDRLAAKRGGGAVVSTLEPDAIIVGENDETILVQINDALSRLAALNLRLARVVECRFFAGYDEEETAKALGITDRTVRRDWVKARAWLRRELDQSADAMAG
ncbi:MAG TPA: ECF-type sigma factor [Alphaproteobacteria bacterium]|nr:ECF-type sigma factor [Alphaproteobacteria bacterium]